MNYIVNKNVKKTKLDNFDFDFLDDFKDYININIYYDIFNSIENIKNIYNFIYIKWYIIKNKLSLNKPVLIKQDIYDKQQFNNIMKKFINKDISIAIMVINISLKYI